MIPQTCATTPVPDLAAAYRAACRLDVTACKPGNVFLASPGHGMTARHFLRSAECSAAALTDPGVRLGDRIYGAVAATRAVVDCNTNLGIVLLCAPLAQAALTGAPQHGLRAVLKRQLAATDRTDAAQVFRAIRLAQPGGLGRSARHDVADEPAVGLLEAMRYAAPRDRIARQYVTGFADLFDTALPWLAEAQERWSDPDLAVTDLYLRLLAKLPDSHVERKHGPAAARRLSLQAGAARERLLRADDAGAALAGLLAFDTRLKDAGINPGTTADLVVATHFLSRVSTDPGRDRRGPPG